MLDTQFFSICVMDIIAIFEFICWSIFWIDPLMVIKDVIKMPRLCRPIPTNNHIFRLHPFPWEIVYLRIFSVLAILISISAILVSKNPKSQFGWYMPILFMLFVIFTITLDLYEQKKYLNSCFWGFLFGLVSCRYAPYLLQLTV